MNTSLSFSGIALWRLDTFAPGRSTYQAWRLSETDRVSFFIVSTILTFSTIFTVSVVSLFASNEMASLSCKLFTRLSRFSIFCFSSEILVFISDKMPLFVCPITALLTIFAKVNTKIRKCFQKIQKKRVLSR